MGTLGPLARAVDSSVAGVRDFFGSFRLAGSLRRENAALHHDLADLEREIARLQGIEEKLARLSDNIGYRPPDAGEVVVADVVYLDQGSWLRTLVLYAGTIRPRRNQPVITDRGLVGRIVVPWGRYAKVLLLNDPSLAVSAMIVRTRQRGLVRGGRDALDLQHIPLKADVREGDEVVTAGLDGIFPRDIPIGRVRSVTPGNGLFLRVEVTPAVDVTALDQVYVLTREAVPAEVREAQP